MTQHRRFYIALFILSVGCSEAAKPASQDNIQPTQDMNVETGKDMSEDVADMPEASFKDMRSSAVDMVSFDLSTSLDASTESKDAQNSQDMTQTLPVWQNGEPVFVDKGEIWRWSVQGLVAAVSDISVVRNDTEYVASFTCTNYLVTPEFPAQICKATSPDGLDWTHQETWVEGGVDPQRFAWEGSELVSRDNQELSLFASSYPKWTQENVATKQFPSTLARLEQGTLVQEPVLAKEQRGLDHDAIFSPGITRLNDNTYLMMYVGYCYPIDGSFTCPDVDTRRLGLSLLAATAPQLEGPWTRIQPPKLPAKFPTSEGYYAAEPDLAVIDERLYMAYSVMDKTQKSRAIALAWTDDFASGDSWTWSQNTVVRASDRPEGDIVIAPSLLWDTKTLKLWYTIVNSNDPNQGETYTLGYAEGKFPDAL